MCVPSGCPDIWWDDASRPLRCCEEVVLWGETHRLSSGHAENTLQREETPIRRPENRPPDQLQAGRGAMGHPCPHPGTCDEFSSPSALKTSYIRPKKLGKYTFANKPKSDTLNQGLCEPFYTRTRGPWTATHALSKVRETDNIN